MVLLGAAPILLARPAPLQDWPNHLARIHILRGLLHHDLFWMRFYRFTGFLVPDAVMDLCLYEMSRLGVPVGIAAQGFLAISYAVFVAGFCMVSRALGAWSPGKPALAVLLFYSNALFWGLVSYVLGLGLMLGLLALWVGAKGAARRSVVAAGGAALLLFTHLVTAALWVIILGCFDLHRLLAKPRGVSRLAGSASWLAALVAIAALLRLLPAHGPEDTSFGYPGGGRLGIVGRKLWLFGKLLLGGSLGQDASSVAALLACGIVIAAARPRLSAAPALAVAALAAAALLAPERIGTGSQLDTRLALPPLLLLTAGVRVRLPQTAVWFASLAVCARSAVLAWSWHASAQQFARYRLDAAELPTGSLMMMAYGTPLRTLSWQQIWSPPITSIATQTVFRNLFMPAIFANPAQQPIGLRARYAGLKQPWNLSDPAHRRTSQVALAAVCARHEFPHIFLTVLYPGTLARQVDGALLRQQASFLILDACRLR